MLATMEKFTELEVKKGDVWLVDLEHNTGSVYKGCRPCIIVSNDLGNKYSAAVILIPLSTSTTKKPLPVHVKLDAIENGLERDSFAATEQIQACDKLNLMFKVGHLNNIAMHKIECAVKIGLGLQ
jgi:mRNA interferase MazF